MKSDLMTPMEQTETIGARLRRLRKSAHLTQLALAVRVGLTQGAIGNIETGDRGYGGSVVGIARALNTSPEYLLLETDDPAPRARAAAPAITQEPELDFCTPEEIKPDAPLSPEAEILGRWFDRLPKNSLKKLQANQTCLQAILDALKPDQPQARMQAQPATAQRQVA